MISLKLVHFISNLNDDCSQLSFDVYIVCVAQNYRTGTQHSNLDLSNIQAGSNWKLVHTALRIFDGLRKIKNLIQGIFLFPSHGLTFYGIGWSVSLRKHIDSRCGIWKNQSSSVHYWLILSVLSENSRTTKEGRTKAGKEKKKKLTTPIILRPSKLVITRHKYYKIWQNWIYLMTILNGRADAYRLMTKTTQVNRSTYKRRKNAVSENVPAIQLSAFLVLTFKS